MSVESRDRGMGRAKAGIEPEWADEAEGLICEVVRQRQFFTVDHIWEAGLSEPKTASHVGIMLKKGAAGGVMRNTGQRYESARGNHDGCTVWESLVCHNGIGAEMLSEPRVDVPKSVYDELVEKAAKYDELVQ